MKLKSFVIGSMIFILTGCHFSTNNKPLVEVNVEYNKHSLEINNDEYKAFADKLSTFSANLSENILNEINDDTSNISISPLSIYMASALAIEAFDGTVRQELLNAMNMTYDEVSSFSKVLFEYSTRKYETTDEKGKKQLTGIQELTNSIWIQKGFEYNYEVLNKLASNYYCYTYETSFPSEGEKLISNFIYEKTHKLINPQLKFSPETIFVLLNTLYFKDAWATGFKELELTDKNYLFENQDNTKTDSKLLIGYYNEGQVIETDTYSSFYTKTLNDYKISFIMPNDGYTLKDVFTKENIDYISKNIDYNSIDNQSNKMYYTRCLFPEFEAYGKVELSSIFSEYYNINQLFRVSDNCNVIDKEIKVSSILHESKVIVNKKGAEGAAYTLFKAECETVAPAYEYVYKDFIVDKSFGFILSDKYGTVLFTGLINKI